MIMIIAWCFRVLITLLVLFGIMGGIAPGLMGDTVHGLAVLVGSIGWGFNLLIGYYWTHEEERRRERKQWVQNLAQNGVCVFGDEPCQGEGERDYKMCYSHWLAVMGEE